MARRYHIERLVEGERIVLGEEVGHHLARVMRIRPGDTLRLFDGRGHEADGVVSAVRRGEVEIEVGKVTAGTREPRCTLIVAFALPKGGRTEWIFEHGTEVGIRVFQPLRCARSAYQPGDDRRGRWQRLAQAATGQCDRVFVPEVRPVQSLAEYVQRRDLPDERYVAAADAEPLERAMSTSAVLVVGPEGGLTEEELAHAIQQGFRPRSLGPLTLRTETAALVGAARLLA